MTGRLEGKIAVVTGGARGIGQAIVTALIAEGAQTVVADIDETAAKTTATELGDRAHAASVDVGDEDSVHALMDSVVAQFGSIDALVCNAGGAKAVNPRRMFTEINRDLWDSVLTLNLTSAWLCAKHAFPVMQEQGAGRIVLMSSASASSGLPLGITMYVAAKGGVEGLGRALARECGPHGIGVNVVAPGFTPVDSVQQLHGAAGTEQIRGEMLARQSRPVVGTAEDIAAAVTFLASSDAKHITGQVIHVDGGWVLS
jgi:3-oxoacyl-[acyl-carrier protein] reductase